jgi:hypothetical protein
MPVHQTQTKIVPLIFPQAVTDADDPVGAYGDANPNSVDTLGFSRADIYVMIGATDIAMTALGVYSGTAVASGADDSDYSAVTGLQASGATGDGRLPTADDDNEVIHFGLDLRNDDIERYLAIDATAGNGSSGTFIVAWCVLSNAEESPNTDAEKGILYGLEV